MKKILLSLFILASTLVSNQANAQVYEKGNVVVDAFYGFPNLFGAIVRNAYDNSSYYSNVKVRSLGPLGICAEYLVGDKIGVGAEFTYATTVGKYDYSGSGTTYSYEESFNRFRILPRLNFHFGSSSQLDPYLTFGMGYGNFKYKLTTNDPSQSGGADVKDPINFSYRMGFGLRYFFNDHIGLMGEFGFGGPLARGGLTF